LKGAHTVLVSSHLLSEISQTCDRLLVLKDGELVAQGTEEELGQRLGSGGFIEVELRGERERALAALRDVGPVRVVREADGLLALRVEASPELRPRVAQAVVGAGLELVRLDRGAEKLESLFLRLTGTEAPEP
jgi:ABC-2 type transport system ATP-binding protein